MLNLRTTLLATGLAVAALATTSPARADLVFGCAGQSGCSANFQTVAGNNTIMQINNANFGDFDISSLTVDPQGKCPGCTMNVSNMELTGTQTGSIQLYISETGLTAAQAVTFIMAMSGTTSGGVTDMRSFYMDTANNGQDYGASGEATFLGSDSSSNPDLKCAGSQCSESALLTKFENIGGLFSITEEIDVYENGVAGSLDSGDNISEYVPEPASLALFGTGLVALGAIRRRRKATKAS